MNEIDWTLAAQIAGAVAAALTITATIASVWRRPSDPLKSARIADRGERRRRGREAKAIKKRLGKLPEIFTKDNPPPPPPRVKPPRPHSPRAVYLIEVPLGLSVEHQRRLGEILGEALEGSIVMVPPGVSVRRVADEGEQSEAGTHKLTTITDELLEQLLEDAGGTRAVMAARHMGKTALSAQLTTARLEQAQREATERLERAHSEAQQRPRRSRGVHGYNCWVPDCPECKAIREMRDRQPRDPGSIGPA